MRLSVPLLLAALPLTACATARQPASTCQSSIAAENAAIQDALQRRFGQQRLGYHVHVKVPRRRDYQGNIMLELYGIAPASAPQPAPGKGETATLLLDPCSHRSVWVLDPQD